jgi:hypothetical protein
MAYREECLPRRTPHDDRSEEVAVNKRADRRKRIEMALDEFRAAIGRALGVAADLHSQAAMDHAKAMVELWLRTEGIDNARRDPHFAVALANPVMSDVVERAEQDRRREFAEWTETGPDALAGIVAASAPGVAGAPSEDWLGKVGDADGTGVLPELWRIGTAVSDSAPESVAFPVAVPLLDTAHLQVNSGPKSRASAEALVEGLLLRVLSYFLPGLVHIHVWDTGQLTGPLPGLYPLTRAGLLTVHDPARPEELLDELSEHIRRVHSGVLMGGHTSVRAISGGAGRRTEPWRIAVLFGNTRPLKDEHQQQLQRIARNGLACGVQLIVVDQPLTVNSSMEVVKFTSEHSGTTSMTGPNATFTADPTLPRAEVPSACAAIADELEERRARLCTFTDLLPGRIWQQSSAAALIGPVGYHDGIPVDVVLGDSSPHALVGGPSGSGKTNFLYAMLGSFVARYSPDELELYLLDFKEGVSFAQFTPGRRDRSWLPHARLVGVNVNADREFGVAMLRFLADEMRRRADATKRHEVTKLEELRREDPDGRWPRIVAVIDEFQYLFAERDQVATEAVMLLEDIARRGRSQGIHLVLASQDVSSIEAFWGKPAIFEQFILRVALPKARRVLAENNEAAVELPRWHAILNHESGVKQGNQISRIPDATSRGTFDALQTRLWENRPESLASPRLFDGSHVPQLADTPDFQALLPNPEPVAMLGQVIDVAGSAARISLLKTPGRNLAVLGSALTDAASVLGAAALSLARQHEPGTALFTLLPLINEAQSTVDDLAERLRVRGHEVAIVGRNGIAALLTELVEQLATTGDTRPHYLLGYAVDSVQSMLEARDITVPKTGLDNLRDLLRRGPEHSIHLLGWWRGAARLKASLPIGSTDDVGSWVAFDVQGQELQQLAGQIVNWSPRAARGLFFDRYIHAKPQVIIPFGVEEASGER